MKDENIKMDDCLKSFDGQITGKLTGYISSKISFGEDYGGGGHQDNVFEEQHKFSEWWIKYRTDSTDILVLLIETDLTTKFARLKEKYADINNIMVFNHIEFQQYIIDTYYNDESI